MENTNNISVGISANFEAYFYFFSFFLFFQIHFFFRLLFLFVAIVNRSASLPTSETYNYLFVFDITLQVIADFLLYNIYIHRKIYAGMKTYSMLFLCKRLRLFKCITNPYFLIIRRKCYIALCN